MSGQPRGAQRITEGRNRPSRCRWAPPCTLWSISLAAAAPPVLQPTSRVVGDGCSMRTQRKWTSPPPMSGDGRSRQRITPAVGIHAWSSCGGEPLSSARPASNGGPRSVRGRWDRGVVRQRSAAGFGLIGLARNDRNKRQRCRQRSEARVRAGVLLRRRRSPGSRLTSSDQPTIEPPPGRSQHFSAIQSALRDERISGRIGAYACHGYNSTVNLFRVAA